MRNRLLVCLGILCLTFFLEFFGGLYSGSLSLVSDSFHVLTDMFSLFLSFLASFIAHKKMPTDRMSYGYHRLEVFSAIVNGLLLVGISVLIVTNAVQRIVSPRAIHTTAALAIAIFGLAINVVCAFMLRRTKGESDLNFKSAYLHLIGDSLSSVSVIAGILIIVWSGHTSVDGYVALLISLWIFYGAIDILVKGTGILLQKSPHELTEIRADVSQIQGVLGFDDIRLWQVCSSLIVGTAHVITSVKTLRETEDISSQIKDLLQNRYKIRHMTLQFESREMADRHSHEFEHQH